jgi:signal peptidase I
MQPWLTVWLKPGDTIERVLAGNPRHSVWVLAALGGMASASQLINGELPSASFDWRVLTALAIAGAVYGVVALYINALCLLWIGKLLGGQASAVQLRAVLAWGGVPYIAVLAISLAVLGTLKASGGAPAFAVGIFFPLFQAVFLVFIFWSLVITLRMIAHVQHFGTWRAIICAVAGCLLVLVISVATAVSIRTSLFQPFNTPSASNKPTMLVGDYIFVSKYAYGYSHYSLPFSPPWFSGRIWAAEPQRGDVVVFRLPKDDKFDYVKRIVGLPGDRIQMIDGLLYINGDPVKRERVEDFINIEDGKSTADKQWHETLPNGASYATLDLVDNGFADNTRLFTVPPGEYFVLGDNRDNSTDSRFSQVGMIPFENLIGRVAMIYYSVELGSGAIRFDRIGKAVR